MPGGRPGPARAGTGSTLVNSLPPILPQGGAPQLLHAPLDAFDDAEAAADKDPATNQRGATLMSLEAGSFVFV